MKTMTPEEFASSRRELISIMNDIVQIGRDFNDSLKSELVFTARKLERNNFEIVLIGEYQGGKSTLFNTICGGRHISPIGIGIKTSACKVSACHLSESKEEYVELFWKSDRELLLKMLPIIERQKAAVPEAQKLLDGEASLLTMKNLVCVKVLKKCILKQWQEYREYPSVFRDKDLLDDLRIATLILEFHDNNDIQVYRKKTKINIEELKEMVKFPIDWETRWKLGDKARFTPKECLFVFLGSAICHIHCKNLERLGCMVTDCPGLFTSPWDTAIAMQALQNADAILLLMRGRAVIGEEEVRVASEIARSNQVHKVFAALNAKEWPRAHICDIFMGEDYSKLVGANLDVGGKDAITVFHARLGYNASQLINNDIDDEAKEVIKDQIYNDLPIYLDISARRSIDTIENYISNPEELFKESNAKELLDKAEKFVVSHKYKSILFTEGALKALKLLEVERAKVLASEDACRKGALETRNEIEASRKILEEYQKEAVSIFDKSLKDERLEDIFFTEMFLNNISNLD